MIRFFPKQYIHKTFYYRSLKVIFSLGENQHIRMPECQVVEKGIWLGRNNDKIKALTAYGIVHDSARLISKD